MDRNSANDNTPTVTIGKPKLAGLNIGWLNVQSITNKVTAVRELINDRSYDVFVATETWHRDSDELSLRRVCDLDYSVFEKKMELQAEEEEWRSSTAHISKQLPSAYLK